MEKTTDKIIEEVRDNLDSLAEGRRVYAEKTAKVAKKYAKKGAAVGVLVLSLLAGLAFSGPAEITGEQLGDSVNRPPVVMDISDYGNAAVEDDDDDATEEKGAKSGIVARFRQAVLSLPSAARILVIMPLWAIGTAILTLISVFWKFLFATPVGGMILASFAGWLVLLGLFTVTAKILFPEIPLSRILSKKNVIILAVVAVGMATADAVAPLFWNKYPFAVGAVKLGVGAAIVALLTTRVKRLFGKDKYKNMPQPA